MKTNPTPTEGQATAQTQPTGLPPGDMGKPKTEADANGQTQPQTTKTLREAKRVAIPVDFDFDVDPEPRPKMDPMNPPEAKQEQNPQSPNPIDAMAGGIEIEFKGQKEMIPLDSARTMLQQFKNMSAMSPVVGLAGQIADAMGIKDPREVAAFIRDAVMKATKGGDPANAAMQQTPPTAEEAAKAAGVPPVVVPPSIPPEVDKVVDDFFASNGLQPTPEVRESMRNMVAYGKHVKDMAAAFPQLQSEVLTFKKAQEVNSQRALTDAVNARAAKVAAELGIDTQEEVQGFQAWVSEVGQTFPGFQRSITTNPDAMDKAIRQYHVFSVGQRALSNQKNQRQQVQGDLSRAGGDAPGGRPAFAQTQTAPKDEVKAFNDDIMARMR